MHTLLKQLSLAAAVALGPGAHSQTEPANTAPSDQAEIKSLSPESEAFRLELASVQMELAKARKELDELRQFILDHHQYGDAFDQYTKIRSLAVSDARRRQTQALQEHQAAREAERAARRQAATEKRRHDQAEQKRLARYRKAGLRPIGLDVFAGRMAYYYADKARTIVDIEYEPTRGRYLKPRRRDDIDFSAMTISGGVLSAFNQPRNIAIAITFFDEAGNQVGGDIIQVINARRDVLYPFTATIDMALNRPFASAHTYVLYAEKPTSTGPAAVHSSSGGLQGGSLSSMIDRALRAAVQLAERELARP